MPHLDAEGTGLALFDATAALIAVGVSAVYWEPANGWNIEPTICLVTGPGVDSAAAKAVVEAAIAGLERDRVLSSNGSSEVIDPSYRWLEPSDYQRPGLLWPPSALVREAEVKRAKFLHMAAALTERINQLTPQIEAEQEARLAAGQPNGGLSPS